LGRGATEAFQSSFQSMNYYDRIRSVATQEEADALIVERTADMMSWRCWCVTPNREEVERIVRGECVVVTSWLKDRAVTERAEQLFGYQLTESLK